MKVKDTNATSLNKLLNGEHHEVVVLINDIHVSDLTVAIDTMRYDLSKKFIKKYAEFIALKDMTFFEEYTIKMLYYTLGIKKFAGLLATYKPVDALEVIEAFDDNSQESIMKLLPADLRVELRERLDLDEGSVGRHMVKHTITLRPHWSIAKSIAIIKQARQALHSFEEMLFVLNDKKVPIGLVTISSLLCNETAQTIKEVMSADIVPFELNANMDDVIDTFTRYELTIAPIVDCNNRFKGVMHITSVLGIFEEESEGEMLHLSGLHQAEDRRTLLAAIQRLPWLVGIIGTGMLSAFMVQSFQATISECITLVVAMPMLSSIAGNIGMQALGATFHSSNQMSAKKIVSREIIIGVFNGVGLALCITALISIVSDAGSRVLGGILLSSVTTIVFAAVVGTSVPLLFKRINLDPAISSSVVVIGMVDIFAIASLLLSYLALHN